MQKRKERWEECRRAQRISERNDEGGEAERTWGFWLETVSDREC